MAAIALFLVAYHFISSNDERIFFGKLSRLNKSNIEAADVYLGKNSIPYNLFDINEERFGLTIQFLNAIVKEEKEKSPNVDNIEYYNISLNVEQDGVVQTIDFNYYDSSSIVYFPKIKCYFKLSAENERLLKRIVKAP